MRATLAVAGRELRSYLLTPTGWVVAALFLLLTGAIQFVVAPQLVGGGFASGRPASLRVFFETGAWTFIVLGPALSMRMLSEELRTGTLEILMTSPIRDSGIVVGKFLGGLGFLALVLAPTLVYVLALEIHGRPDYGEIACGYVGLLLLGSALLATGVLFSALTASQPLAYLLTLFAWLLLLLATMGLPALAGAVEALGARPDAGALARGLAMAADSAARLAEAANPIARLRGFVIGLFDSANVVYFAAVSAVALFAATRALGLRRWP